MLTNLQLSIGAAMIGVYLLASGIYNAFFSPLRKVKGPILNSVSWLPWYRYWFSGHMHLHVLELHEKYGPAVRIGPSEVSFIDAKAWKDIYSIKRSKQIERDPNSFPSLTPHGSKYDLLTTKPSDHDRYRQILNTYFSERFVKSYEPIIQENAKIMILQLSAGCQGKESNSNHSGENITKWFQWLAFDIIGDVTWGRSFGCVTDRVSHPCLALSMDLVSMSSFIVFVSWWTALKNWLVRLSGVEAMFINLVRSKCTASTQIKQEKATLYSNIVKDGNPLTQLELDGNLTAIVIAGSETTGFALTATSYYLAKNPGCFQKAAAEVRSSFQTADEINDEALKKLPYLQAIIKEALRLTPAEPNGLARKVVVEHMEINEQYIPKDTAIYVSQFAANRHPSHFHLPSEFHPERWLTERPEEFRNDKRDVVQPFIMGANVCIGRGLAWSSMRIVMARMLFQFDWTVDGDGGKSFENAKAWHVWMKNPVRLKLVEKGTLYPNILT